MDNSTWTIVGVIVTIIALIVGILQLVKSNGGSSKSLKSNQKIGDGSTANQQTHSGNGDNINAGGDVNLK